MVLIEGGDRVERVRLTDGTVLDVDVVVVGIGVAPNTDWLQDSGLTIDNGVVCDETCLAAPGVVAAGDVARWPNARFGEVMRVEHWDNAIEMGAHAARTLLADLAGARGEPFAPVPWFWSDQYDRKIQLAGRSGADDTVEVVSGSVEERRFVALYGRGGRLVGVLGMNQPAKVMRWRALIEEGWPWDEALALAPGERVTGAAFLLLALALVVAAGNWLAVAREHKALEYVCKPLTMVVLFARDARARCRQHARCGPGSSSPSLLCLIGDVFLMLPQDLFVFGLASFLLGHIAYIVGMHVDGVDRGPTRGRGGARRSSRWS